MVRGMVAGLAIGVLCLAAAGCHHGWQGRQDGRERLAPPLPRAHAHNDYLHEQPLLDALAHGFGSVEADIHLVEGRLLVAHDRDEVRLDRTLTGLYLEPLLERYRRFGGCVYPGEPEFQFTLLIDIKSEAVSTYQALHQTLLNYREMLTVYRRGEVAEPGAVTVIVSGNRPRAVMEAQWFRMAALDGRLSDLAARVDPGLMPLISDRWGDHFDWNGEGPMPEVEWEKLRNLVRETHRQGKRLRFWAIPDQSSSWEVMRSAGVDLINTDDLAGLADFLQAKAVAK